MKKIKEVIADYKLLLDNVPALVTATFLMSTCLMNLMAAKIIFSVGGAVFTGGFILSAMPFLCMDTVVKRFNARAGIMLNILSAVGNIIAVILLAIVAAIPTTDDYTHFNYIVCDRLHTLVFKVDIANFIIVNERFEKHSFVDLP